MTAEATTRLKEGGRAELPVKTWAAPGVPSERLLPTPTVVERVKANMGMAQVTVLNIGVFLLTWEWMAAIGVFPSIFFPRPTEIFAEYVSMIGDGSLAHHFSSSLINLAIGFGLAASIGVIVGLIAGTFKWVNMIISPYYWSLYSMPSIAIWPLLVLWLGFGRTAKIILIIISAVMPVLINTIAGVGTVDPVLVRVGKSMNASRLQRYRKIVIPFTLPFILAGFKQGMSHALSTLVVSEMLGSTQGLGYIIIRKVEGFNPAGVFAVLLLLAAMAMIMAGSMSWLQGRVTPWSKQLKV